MRKPCSSVVTNEPPGALSALKTTVVPEPGTKAETLAPDLSGDQFSPSKVPLTLFHSVFEPVAALPVQ